MNKKQETPIPSQLNREELEKWVEKKIWSTKVLGTSLRIGDEGGFSKRATVPDIVDIVAQALAEQRGSFFGNLRLHFGTEHDTFCKKKGEQFRKCAICVCDDIIASINQKYL